MKKEKYNNQEENDGNEKKKKKSIIGKVFIILFIILLLAILAYAGYFFYNYSRHKTIMEENNIVYDPLSASALGIDPEKLKEVGRINLLILGESDANQGSSDTPYYLTDTIMVMSYNPQTQQASILSIPRDTYVGSKNKNTASSTYLQSYKVNSVYRNRTNLDEAIKCISNLIGIELNYYVLIDTDAIVDVVDAIGGVWFNVPIDMDYEDLNQDLIIHLEAGEQLIDGNKAEQLLRFRHNQDGTSYPTEYGDNDLGRMRTQREFIQETAKQLLRIENAGKIVSLLDIVFKNVKTNLSIQEMKYYIPYAFKFDTSNIITDVLPGEPEKCNGTWIYTADKAKTAQVVEDLFTDKIIEEVTEVEANSNTDGQATTSTENMNTITSEQTENAEKSITIELLNGTQNSEILSKIKNELKQKGYTISKSGTTTQTETTTIINRTKQDSSTSKDLKETLGAGTIQAGSDNSKVDYTIIIGEDCI